MPPQKASYRRLSEREQRQTLRAFRRCQALVEKARKVRLTVGHDLGKPPAFSSVARQDRRGGSREIARQLQVPRIELWRAWRYVSVMDKYPRLAPPTCGLERALWIGHILDRTPETERESQLADLLRLPKRALQLRYQHSHSRRRPQPKAPKKLRGRKLQRISGAIWHERLAEIRQHFQQLSTRGAGRTAVRDLEARGAAGLSARAAVPHRRADAAAPSPR